MNNINVYIEPKFTGLDKGDGGIRQVVQGQKQHLPSVGMTVVNTLDAADVVFAHAGNVPRTTKPMVGICHGMYWLTYDWKDWSYALNAKVIENMRRADVVTAPTKWVAHVLERNLLQPMVAHHGLNIEDWPLGKSQGYVLWNKTRPDPVTNPADMNELALRVPATPFISTYGQPQPNVEIIGRVPFNQMQSLIKEADVYLATAEETFGIGTLEAMASGVPVLGWHWGGQAEIVEHLVTGYLAEPGDYDDLTKGLAFCQEHRDELGQAGRDVVIDHFQWKDVIHVYREAAEKAIEIYQRPVKVSIVVPCYNQGGHLATCVRSLQNQTMKDWELIIVNDASPDNTGELAEELALEDDRIMVIHNKENQYLAEARNVAFRVAQGKYFIPLDADDQFAPDMLEVLSAALDNDPNIDIVYTGLLAVNAHTGEEQVSTWPPAVFNYEDQLQRNRNQLHYSSMYRRAVWENTGGYRRRWRSAEDGEFWGRAVSYGYRPQKVTASPMLIKLEHQDSMGFVEDVPDFNSWYPWKRDPTLTPYMSIGTPVSGRPSWDVPNFSRPKVSVIIPCKPGHDVYLQDAIDSVLGQTYRNWEVIVVNDGAAPFIDDTLSDTLRFQDRLLNPYLQGFPFVRIVDGEEGVCKGPGWARNSGVDVAVGNMLVFLDADDILQPHFIELTLKTLVTTNGGWVYTDCFNHRLTDMGRNDVEHFEVPDWDTGKNFDKATHAVTVMLPREIWEEIGGFDEDAKGWEDWEFFIRAVQAGYCGTRLAVPLLTYRMMTGNRREENYLNRDKHYAYIVEKHAPYYKGAKEKRMGCNCGNGGGKKSMTLHVAAGPQQSEAPLIEYIGDPMQQRRLKGKVTGKIYLYSGQRRRFYMHVDDAIEAVKHADFVLVDQTTNAVQTLELGDPIMLDRPMVNRALANIGSLPPVLIQDLPLKDGIKNALEAAGYITFEHLQSATEEALGEVSGIGPQRLEAIRGVLNASTIQLEFS